MAVRPPSDRWPPPLSGPSQARDRPVALSKGAIGLLIKFGADLVTACVASVAGLVWAQTGGLPLPPVWMMACYAPMVLVIFAARSTYRRKLHNTLIGEFMSVQTTAALAAMLLLAGMALSGVPGNLSDTITKVWLTTAVFLPVGRVFAVLLKRQLRQRRLLQSPTLVMGNGAIASHLARRFLDNPQYGILPIGLIDADTPWSVAEGDACPIPALGTPATIGDVIRSTRAEALVVAFSRTRDAELIPAIRTARLAGLTVWVVPRMFDTMARNSRVDYVGGLPVLTLSNTNPNGWQFAVKHVVDRVLAAAILLAISPLFLFLMVAVRFSSAGPVFFRQARIGRDGIVFDCLKFRSMRPPRPSDADFVVPDGCAPGGIEGVDRRTAIGRFMRSSSLDELPQLLNVIKGEMSLVGPRPERPEFVDLFNTQIRRYGERHRVKAGVTGWAQVHGLRGQTSISDRAEWDNFYIENWSLSLDLQILLMTVPAVLRPAERMSRRSRPATSSAKTSPIAGMPTLLVAPHPAHAVTETDLHIVSSATAAAASAATQQIREWLAQRVNLDAERCSDVTLAAYEAMSNVAEHAYGDRSAAAEMSLEVTHDAPTGTVHVRVADRGTWLEPETQLAESGRGRGLMLMRALSDEAIVEGRRDGTTVCLHFQSCPAPGTAQPEPSEFASAGEPK